ncbi:MAG: hypothetical protein OXG44_12230, partial [Gammaproteobacteria bacterium]|nr:hypothetical protein [Gammaproteobacteria bacterium]
CSLVRSGCVVRWMGASLVVVVALVVLSPGDATLATSRHAPKRRCQGAHFDDTDAARRTDQEGLA